ncbi:hypothetical protein [Luteimonas saliphila]|uniref:hypothetical protein n=1 Tax=Luteimonas saliphila TaxID=2804919 RepID=UPI00192D74F6|nr:hypothetical protein [Luteimonas saliphila]
MTEQKTDAPRSSAAPPKTDFVGLLDELNAGIFLQQINAALSDVALGTALYGDKGKAGEVTIKMKLTRIGESSQVAMKHTLSFSKPTTRGKASEEASTETPLYVHRGGKLAVMPEEQGKFDFG